MTTRDLTGTTAIVTGASRGFGRSIAASLAQAGAKVVAVARDGAALEQLREQAGDAVTPVVGDAADPVLAGRLLATYSPDTLVLNAGALPLPRPLQMHTWETFNLNWDMDVRQAFNWSREALLKPLAPGSTVISFSSAAAIGGSPMSGGYAGAKATVKFISAYAAGEAQAGSLGIRFVSVLPGLSAATQLGAAGAQAYADRMGIPVSAFLERMGPELTTEHVGKAIVDLAADESLDQPAYMVGPNGLNPLG
ncbi:short-chain dehydrogenase/reductase SDR [Catenulispora acidiphila DSM 44928]|uniref:Short-chain dehydrogenase/reductase SDR n=1 Tax=Catenulispora acidiphila (strain DSM 44928 / JCM 14897 / NBRC 102108 / NRRL B-24433 / ID139908) TaxID=479433 RepID=C7QKD7_CATAD|nr:SDR family oxidoreductase [Catenulispora acidiphila]ACU75211.1 short-chain dehydrogenase/reductase SDR [Catenulispora acidiphila DSM 44928]